MKFFFGIFLFIILIFRLSHKDTNLPIATYDITSIGCKFMNGKFHYPDSRFFYSPLREGTPSEIENNNHIIINETFNYDDLISRILIINSSKAFINVQTKRCHFSFSFDVLSNSDSKLILDSNSMSLSGDMDCEVRKTIQDLVISVKPLSTDYKNGNFSNYIEPSTGFITFNITSLKNNHFIINLESIHEELECLPDTRTINWALKKLP